MDDHNTSFGSNEWNLAEGEKLVREQCSPSNRNWKGGSLQLDAVVEHGNVERDIPQLSLDSLLLVLGAHLSLQLADCSSGEALRREDSAFLSLGRVGSPPIHLEG